MSSHHIVREKQEPALLVFGLDNFDDEQLGQLLEWSPTLIAAPLIAEKLISLGIKIDWIITDDVNHGLHQSDIKYFSAGADNLINAVLNFLVTQNYPAVNIVTDELELKDYLPYAEQINLVIFHNRQKIYAVNSGFSKWKPANETIKLLMQPGGLETTGLEQISINTYTTLADGFFSINFNAPFLFIAESL